MFKVYAYYISIIFYYGKYSYPLIANSYYIYISYIWKIYEYGFKQA
jgi:hypothetical protein